MSVIWSGVTEEGAVVPVQVTAEGKVVAVGDGPEGDYLKLTGGNLTGDLTLGTDKIKLDATLGSATFAADATINTLTVGKGGGSVVGNTAVGLNALLNNTEGNENTAVGGSALKDNTAGNNNTALGSNALKDNTTGNENTAVGREALNGNTEGNNNTAVGRRALALNTTGSRNAAVGQYAGYYIEGDNNTILGAYLGTAADKTLNNTVIISAGPTKRMQIDSNGIATFSGDVVVRSRSKQWMLVEQGGLCHMVQQVKATTADLVDPDLATADLVDPDAAEYPRLRDVFAELNVIEKALEEVMEKLRMTEPDGWPVWDGSDNA